MINNYDNIANGYDFLSRLVFGKSQVIAQVNQLKDIPQNGRLLIAGGGTGWILEELSAIYPSGLKITYVELSGKMIEKSKKRNVQQNAIEFFNMGIEDYETNHSFDAILTPFLFDNFSAKRAEAVFFKLDKLLRMNGRWFLTDFTLTADKGKWWKWLMLKFMYIFFKVLRIVEAVELTDMTPYFLNSGYHICKEQYYYGKFIKATIYKKIR